MKRVELTLAEIFIMYSEGIDRASSSALGRGLAKDYFLTLFPQWTEWLATYSEHGPNEDIADCTRTFATFMSDDELRSCIRLIESYDLSGVEPEKRKRMWEIARNAVEKWKRIIRDGETELFCFDVSEDEAVIAKQIIELTGMAIKINRTTHSQVFDEGVGASLAPYPKMLDPLADAALDVLKFTIPGPARTFDAKSVRSLAALWYYVAQSQVDNLVALGGDPQSYEMMKKKIDLLLV